MAYDLTRLGAIALSLDEMQKDCAITLALKIVDDSCKMDDYERAVFMALFDLIPFGRSDFFESTVHDVIAQGRANPTAQLFGTIKNLRESAMRYLTQERMKAYKAYVRAKLEV
ncbi:MAG: hypothetical protein KU37_06755 [Sulfuricurvum sp. PC08-66]|nr:MAG: hypothetical protein KU37_06755 [Sulfuricurvum sp. PC08-66]